MAGSSYRLPKHGRLRRRRLIEPLFDRDDPNVSTLAHGCVRAVFRVINREKGHVCPVMVGFAPGRINRAVKRNRIKRQLREVYRHHQHSLLDVLSDSDRVLTMMLLFRGRPEQARTCVRSDLPVLLERIVDRLKESAGPA